MIDRCWSGDLHAFTVDKDRIVCADCLLAHEDWRVRGGCEARYLESVRMLWMSRLGGLT
jgi:hypothetical protein